MNRTVYATFEHFEQARAVLQTLVVMDISPLHVTAVTPEICLHDSPSATPFGSTKESRLSSHENANVNPDSSAQKEAPQQGSTYTAVAVPGIGSVIGSGAVAAQITSDAVGSASRTNERSLAQHLISAGVPSEIVRVCAEAHHARRTVLIVNAQNSNSSEIERAIIIKGGLNVHTVD